MADAKALPFEEREQLIAGLLEDDETPLSDEWMAEIDRRIKEIEDGTAKTIPAEEFFAEMRRKLNETRSLSSGA